ncbi:MAG: hypothetical protein Q9174_000224 [Haloplaca sp. 1 TL-2023]
MGLASKLAAAQPPGGYGAPPPQQHQQTPYPPQLQAGQKPGAYTQQLPQGLSYQVQPGSQYPPPQQQGTGQYGQQYGGPPSQGGSHETGVYKQLLQTTIQQKQLQNMIPPNHPNLDRYAQRAAGQVQQACSRWNLPSEVGQDLVKLALFDVILYIDNSGSMQMAEDGERIRDLKLIVNRVVGAATLFDDDGISIRFMNEWNSNPAMDGFDMRRLDGIRDERMVEHIVSKIQFVGLTPLGTELRNKVIEPLVLGPARNRQLQKPVLIITVTDGSPAGEMPQAVFDVIRAASDELSRMPQYGPGAVSFQFAQVGNDQGAREFLAKLDSDAHVGRLVDCTSNFENEQTEMMQTSPGLNFTPDLWLAKMLLGSIDSSYDTKDESTSRPPGGQNYGMPPQGSYGGGPGGYGQQQYPPQQGNYGQAQQQQYGGPPAQQGYASHNPGPQGYGQQQPPNYGQAPQQSYGRPAQSSYNAPQPPRY